MMRFCIKYGIPQYAESASVIAGEMLQEHLAEYKNVTLRLSYGEIKDEVSLDFMIRDLDHSPLTADMDIGGIKSRSRKIIEEPTSLGYRVKIVL